MALYLIDYERCVMGLDMYLSAEIYVSEYFEGGKEILEDLKKLDLIKRLNGKQIKTLSVEVGYWRKANEIHKWFVDNVQDGVDDCKRSYVSREQLQELLDIVERVLAEPELGPELLPTESGFFFGGTDYDEFYIQDLEETKKIIQNILNDSVFNGWDFYYQSSW